MSKYLCQLRCENCNGALYPKTLTCPYCGAQYERASDLMGSIHYIQTCPAKTSTLGYVMSVDEFDMERIPQEALAEHCMREMTYKLAEALVPYIKIETERDILTRRQIIRGSVRVIDPDFRF